MGAAGIKDVAELANVSVATVSRILNNRGYISEHTRKKVQEAIRELNYTPNQLARNLYRQKSDCIGLLIPDVRHPFFADVTKYVETLLYLRGYKLMLCNTTGKSNRERDYITMLRQNKVDGIIIGSHALDVEEYTQLKLPIVSLDMELGDKIFQAVSDHITGGQLAAQVLVESGCKRVLQMSGNSNVRTPSLMRYHAFQQACEAKNVACITVSMGEAEFDLDDYYHQIFERLRNDKQIDGFFGSDILAMHCIKACRALGRRVSQDLCVVGYDNTYLAGAVAPRLTVISQDIGGLAEHLVENLLLLIDGKEPEQYRMTLPVSLIRGETTR